MIPIVPFCKRQLHDINKEHIISDTLRWCDIETAMNGIDRFRSIYKRRFNVDTNPRHIVTQVYGCTNSCAYCYVTPDGVWGLPVHKEIKEVFDIEKNQYPNDAVLHLMGGAPALYLKEWPDLMRYIVSMNPTYVFHSDFLLNEGLYEEDVLDRITMAMNRERPPLFAVSIKKFQLSYLQIENLYRLVSHRVAFYITFTGMAEAIVASFKRSLLCLGFNESIFADSYNIPIYMGFKALNKNNCCLGRKTCQDSLFSSIITGEKCASNSVHKAVVSVGYSTSSSATASADSRAGSPFLCQPSNW